MEIANAWLLIGNELQSNVPLFGLTPPEAILLEHTRKRAPEDKERKVIHIKVVGNDDRSVPQEKDRLDRKYGRKTKDTTIAEEVFGKVVTTLPQTFKDAGFETGDTEPPKGKLFDYTEAEQIAKTPATADA